MTAITKRTTKTKTKTARSSRLFTLNEMMIVLVIVAFLAGGAIGGRILVENARIQSQISQIEALDQAVAGFYDKYKGLPGDLIYSIAQDNNLPYGSGAIDGGNADGKITPCSGESPQSFGCENALFWAQLSAAHLIEDDFSAAEKFSASTLISSHNMNPYLPKAALDKGVFITVWNADMANSTVGNHLPYGNYYEITALTGASRGQLLDEPRALTPVQARAIDEKTDDGSPKTGRIMVNGNADSDGSWSSFAQASDNNCIASDDTYNTYEFLKSSRSICHIAVAINCCETEAK